MQKIIDKAIGVIQHELIRSIDEFYEKDELTQNKISKSWNLILHELNDHCPLGDWYKEAKRRKVIEDEYRETMVAVRKAEKKLEEKRRTK
jgi:hypothetical protein